MKQSPSELVRLAPDNLFGTDGVLKYTSYDHCFCGQFDIAGEPVFQHDAVPQEAPIVQRHEGQRFDGFWLPHGPMPFVVLDTGHLRLGFECSDILQHPMSASELPRLRIESVVLHDRGRERSTLWRIYQYSSPTGEPPHLLSPPFSSPYALAPSNTGSRWVSRAEALAYLTEEQKFLTNQRHELTPHPGLELTPPTAQEAACLSVLGEEYFRVMMEQWHLREMLRTIDSERPDPRIVILSHLSRGEIVASLERQAPEFERTFINDRAAWLLARDRALQNRHRRLERLQTSLEAQVAIPVQTLALRVTPAAKPPVSRPDQAQSVSQSPGQNPSPQGPKPKPNGMRIQL